MAREKGRLIGLSRPSLRTGRADFPHPALPSTSDSVTETGDSFGLGLFQAEQPKFGNVAVLPSQAIASTGSAIKFPTFAQYAVDVHDVDVSAFKQFIHPSQRIATTAPGSESVALRAELPLEDRLDHRLHRGLDHSVSDHRDSQWPLFRAPRLRYANILRFEPACLRRAQSCQPSRRLIADGGIAEKQVNST
ncbi:MAG: hypothetical protein A2X46_12385 [Lentisphaerae bacterium GWF2_57_35]|nr:MAG: hypothetical protein A2X46_12385 [Lentisphaerae bacterium GWF2_57_35]